jgi:hypothetical protein
MEGRLPTHLEVSGLIRAVDAAGGFATVIARGDRDAGTILVVCCHKGANWKLFERMPHPDGRLVWTQVRSQDVENPMEFSEYLARRQGQDRDLWIVELDIARAERFIGINSSES